jgi:2-polyprenyl-6-methoxyphenol hydroxylase-like FAD-dependent oxidoreductase
MGRSSRLSDWLAAAGWERPAMRRMTINLNYATADFRRDGAMKPLVGLAFNWPGEPEGGAAFVPIEADRWRVLIAAFNDEHPGRTPEDLVRRFTTKYPPVFGDVVRGELLGEVRTYRHADSRRRDFTRLTRLPARLIAVGDAVASFNPVYGQGMSAAALHAACLALYLRSGPDLAAPASDYFKLQEVVVDAAWSMSTNADLALPHVDGPYPRGYRITNWFATQIVDASTVDVEIARRFNSVTGMASHPSVLGTPAIVLRALRANLRRADAVRPPA